MDNLLKDLRQDIKFAVTQSGRRVALRRFAGESPAELDMTNSTHQRWMQEVADLVLRLYPEDNAIEQLEATIAAQQEEFPLLVQLAVKLAKSKLLISDIRDELDLSIVFAVDQEQQHILPHKQHRFGEDFLLAKVAQLDWLLGNRRNVGYELIIIDDGGPEGSGATTQSIIDERRLSKRVRVEYLAEAIAAEAEATKPLTSADDSQPGSAIVYGMWQAAQAHKENHIIICTSAGPELHLGQVGLLVDAIVTQGTDCAIGSRHGANAITIKESKRNKPAALATYLWKRMLPPIQHIVDVQCGFNAFSAAAVRAIIPAITEKGCAFDIELLLKTELRRAGSIAEVPIAWIEYAGAKTAETPSYLPLLHGVATIYRTCLPQQEEPESFATLVESLRETKWKKLAKKTPAEILERDQAELAAYNDITAAALAALLEPKQKPVPAAVPQPEPAAAPAPATESAPPADG